MMKNRNKENVYTIQDSMKGVATTIGQLYGQHRKFYYSGQSIERFYREDRTSNCK